MEEQIYKPKNSVKVVTATSLFDGHDAAIGIMRRFLQDSGAEVIHIGKQPRKIDTPVGHGV